MSNAQSSHRPQSLKDLALGDAGAPPPFDYEEFARRCARKTARRRAASWGAVACLAVAGVIIGLAMQASPQTSSPQTMVVETGLQGPSMSPAMTAAEPALVNVGHTLLREDLADRIAWFDAALSAGRAEALPAAEIYQMRRARDELQTSLQRVSFAHALLEY